MSKQQSASVVGEGFRVVARAEDQIIEAVERTNPEQFVLAVKWHPERSFDTDPASQALSCNSSKKRASTTETTGERLGIALSGLLLLTLW